MKPTHRAGILAALVLLCAAPLCAAESEPTTESWDAYKSVVERNIFVRQRGIRPAESPVFQAPPAPPAESYIVLRGIVQRGGECTAFWEDIRTGESRTLRAGDALGSGRIGAIALDYAEYESDGASRRVAVGESLTGTAAVPTTLPDLSEALSGAPAATSTGTAGPPPSAEEAAILERLRQRRENEGGR